MNSTKYQTIYAALVCAITLLAAAPAQAYESPIHIFSIDDVLGGFDGATYGPAGSRQDTGIICGISSVCPAAAPLPMVDKEGVTLYPVDSEFGFYVVDFLGAEPKDRDDDYMEGFVGNIMDGDTLVGIKVSNAATDRYKVKKPYGTWCQGLGGTSIKCSTEHYPVMEHVLSCHEVLPYRFADPLTGEQDILGFPGLAFPTFDCDNAELDDRLFIVEDGEVTAIPFDDATPGILMDPNDNTTVLDDIAAGSDYTVTLKDDGKVLYRWGGLIKRPNDVRMYARLPLPEQWRDETGLTTGYNITSAQLIVNHWITNNPNDQLRPEDLENEAATGRKFNYAIDRDPVNGDQWKSTVDCYEGDGDYLDTEEGAADPHELGLDSVLVNERFADPNLVSSDPPLPFSSGLKGGFTNAYFTTINRDPFEWSYRNLATDADVYEFLGMAMPLTAIEATSANLELVSGPRWRLRSNKFGQDIPGVEIPLVECSAPPFTKENIKYEVGEMVTTVINLLDWDEVENGPSPLSNSKGWIDVTENKFVIVDQVVNGVPVTTNGLPMSPDFDLAVYIKGDRKPTAVYNARLVIEFDDEIAVDPTEFDVAITGIYAPDEVVEGTPFDVLVDVTNLGPAAASGAVELYCLSNRDDEWTFTPYEFLNEEDGWTALFRFEGVGADVEKPAKITCEATAVVLGDIDPTNNTDSIVVKVIKK